MFFTSGRRNRQLGEPRAAFFTIGRLSYHGNSANHALHAAHRMFAFVLPATRHSTVLLADALIVHEWPAAVSCQLGESPTELSCRGCAARDDHAGGSATRGWIHNGANWQVALRYVVVRSSAGCPRLQLKVRSFVRGTMHRRTTCSSRAVHTSPLYATPALAIYPAQKIISCRPVMAKSTSGAIPSLLWGRMAHTGRTSTSRRRGA